MILIGKNGVGKSSLFDLITGILKPIKGEIKINNVPVEDLENSKRRFFLYLPHQDCLKNNLTIVTGFQGSIPYFFQKVNSTSLSCCSIETISNFTTG